MKYHFLVEPLFDELNESALFWKDKESTTTLIFKGDLTSLVRFPAEGGSALSVYHGLYTTKHSTWKPLPLSVSACPHREKRRKKGEVLTQSAWLLN